MLSLPFFMIVVLSTSTVGFTKVPVKPNHYRSFRPAPCYPQPRYLLFLGQARQWCSQSARPWDLCRWRIVLCSLCLLQSPRKPLEKPPRLSSRCILLFFPCRSLV